MNARRALLVLWLVAAGNGYAAPPTGEAVTELMNRSGLGEQLAKMAKDAPASVDAEVRGTRETPASLRRREMLRSAFAKPLLLDATRDYLVEHLEAADVTAASDWFASPVAMRFTAMSDPVTNWESAQQEFAGLPKARRDFMLRVAEASGAADMTTGIMMVNFAYGHADCTANGGLTVEQARERVAPMREETRAKALREMAASVALQYAMVSEGDLREFLTFAESPAGRRFYTASTAAFVAAYDGAAARLGELSCAEEAKAAAEADADERDTARWRTTLVTLNEWVGDYGGMLAILLVVLLTALLVLANLGVGWLADRTFARPARTDTP